MYKQAAYDELEPRARQLYNYLVRYHQSTNGRRASHAEMRTATGFCRETLLGTLVALENAGLFQVERDNRGKARSYELPGERWSHPHLLVLEVEKSFYTRRLVDA